MHKRKEDLKEQKRISKFVEDEFYPLVLKKSDSVVTMKRCAEMVNKAIQQAITVKVEKFKEELRNTKLGELTVQPLKGKGEELEREIIELLKHETLGVADMITSRWPIIVDSYIHVEMLNRKPTSLKIKKI